MAPDLISLAQAALMLRCPYRRAFDLALTGELDAVQVGARWFVARSSVERRLRPAGAVSSGA